MCQPRCSTTPLKHARTRNTPKYVLHVFVRLYAGSGRMDVIHSFGYNGDEHADFVRRYGLTVPLAVGNGTFVYGGDKGVEQRSRIGAGVVPSMVTGFRSWRNAATFSLIAS